VLLFISLVTFSYIGLAHGPVQDGPTRTRAPLPGHGERRYRVDLAVGALDFAGGTVVHINAGVAGLVGAVVLGKRVGLGRESMPPHNLTMTMIGASMLWFGWFGFNAGSALEANGFAALAFMNTFLATACAVLSWTFAEWLLKGKPSMLGAASAPSRARRVPGRRQRPVEACDWPGVGVVCFWGCTGLKKMIGADDALDVFGVHALGGIRRADDGHLQPSLSGRACDGLGDGHRRLSGRMAQLFIRAKAVSVSYSCGPQSWRSFPES
jgi:Amt family ammonium transporter